MSKLVCCLISTILVGILHGVHGSSLYKEQPVHTIKTQKGQVYDCVDFHKQRSLNHHQAQLRKVKMTSLQSQAKTFKDLGLKESCPSGTVPILRSSNNLKSPLLDSSTNGIKRHCIAVLRSRPTQGQIFHGASGEVSIYRPLVYGKQWSASRMKLSNGQDSIEAGWMVNPDKFKDTEAHFYAKFTAGSDACLNFDCPGFVQVSKWARLGLPPQQYSQIGQETQYTWAINITKNAQDGNWWLTCGLNNEQVGYWPKSLFTSMAEVASLVEWGGEVDNPESEETNSLYMGSGLTARDSTKLSANYGEIRVREGDPIYDDPGNTEEYSDCEDYTTYDWGNQGPQYGRTFLFGGPHESIDGFPKLQN